MIPPSMRRLAVLATLVVAVRDLDRRCGRRVAASVRAAARPAVPAPEIDRAVYDYAGHPVARTRSPTPRPTIDAIEARTGAEVVVYTQDSGEYPDDRGDRGEGARPDGPVGRRSQGLQRRAGHLLRHAAEPRARPGPAVRGPGLRGGLPVERGAPVDLRERHAAVPRSRPTSTARSASRSRRSTPRRRPSTPPPSSAPARSTRSSAWSVRSVVFLGLSGWAFFNWRRYGKDPVYLDDPSVLMPAPPPDLTAASGAMIMDGATSRRALTTAMLDLASRGLIAFREDNGGLLGRRQEGRRSTSRPAAGDAGDRGPAPRSTSDGRPARPRRSRSRKLQALGARRGRRFISPDDLPKFGSRCRRLRHARSRITSSTAAGSGRRPSKVVARWAGRGVAGHRRRRHRAHRRAQHPVLRADPASAAAAIAAGIVVLDHRPGDAGGDDAPAR